MEGKIKFIIVALTGILLISLFLNWQVYNAKLQTERERDLLEQENASLNSKIEESFKDNRQLKSKIGSLSAEIEKLVREKDRIQGNLDLANKQKLQLARKLKAQSQKMKSVAGIVPAQQLKPVSSPVVDDTYWAAVLKEKSNLELQLRDISDKLESLSLKNKQLTKEKAALELQVKNINNEKQELKRQLEYNQKSLDNLAQELVREKNDKFQMQGNLENSVSSLKDENAVLKKQLSTLANQKIELENKLAGINSEAMAFRKEKSDLENKLRVMDSLVQENISQIDRFKEKLEAAADRQRAEAAEISNKGTVELPPIVVRPKTEPKAVRLKGLTGKILTVNKDNNFVIIDLGQGTGLELGDSFRVYNARNKEIASLEVIQIREDIAACDIKTQTGSISVGDTIR